MTCIVAYDIEENPIRVKLSKYLESKGTRIQKSVFAVEIERHAFKGFLRHLKRLAGDKGKVAVFRLCIGCEKNAIQSVKIERQFYIF